MRKPHRILLLFACILATTQILSQEESNNPSTASPYQKGVQFYDQEKWPEAAHWLRHAVADNPQMEAAWYNLALAYFQMNDYLETELTLENLFSVNPLHEKAHMLYGLALYHRGAYLRAIKAFNFSIDYSPTEELRLARAYSYISNGNPKYGLPDFDDILYEDPGNFKACLGKGAALVALEKYQYALRFFNRLLDMNPEHIEALTNRAICYAQLGEKEKSAADFNLAMSIEVNIPLLLAMAKCQLKYGNFTAAISSIKAAIRVASKDPEVYFVLGEIEMASGQYKEARQSFDIAIDLDHTLTHYYLSRSEATTMAEDYEAAIKDIYQVLDREPDNEKAKEMLLWVYSKMDQKNSRLR